MTELDYLLNKYYQYRYIDFKDPKIEGIEFCRSGLLIITDNPDNLCYKINISYRGKRKKYLCVELSLHRVFRQQNYIRRTTKVGTIGHTIFIDKTRVMAPKEYLAYVRFHRFKEIYNEIIRLTKEDGYNLIPMELK